MAIYLSRSGNSTQYGYGTLSADDDKIKSKYLGTSYILTHKADFEPGRTSDFILKVKFKRDLYDMEGNKVCSASEAEEALALSIRNFTGPSMSVDPISIRTGNGIVQYAGAPQISNSPITFTDYIGKKTEQILLAWYCQVHNPLNDKIGFKEYYANDALLYKWAPNGTRQISWWIMGAWINEYNQGNFDRSNPDQRQFSTTIMYDRCIPYGSLDTTDWVVENTGDYETNKAYAQADSANYLGTQSGQITAET